MNKLTAFILTCIIFLAYHSKAALPDIITDPNTRDTVEYLDAKIKGATSSGSDLSANGYYYLPGGLLMQWGKYTGGANSPTVTYSKAFTTLLSLSVTIEGASGQNGAMVEPHTVGLTSFVGNQRRHDAVSLTSNFWWTAIGK